MFAINIDTLNIIYQDLDILNIFISFCFSLSLSRSPWKENFLSRSYETRENERIGTLKRQESALFPRRLSDSGVRILSDGEISG